MRQLAPLFEDDRIYTSGEVARILGNRSIWTVIEWANKGWLACFRTPGGQRRYRGTALNRFTAKHPHLRP